MELNVQKRKKPGKLRIKVTIVILILFVAGAAVLLTSNLGPAMSAYAKERVKVMAVKAMNDAIIESLKNEESYSKLVEIHEIGEKVYMLQANSRNMNLFAANTAENALMKISQMGEQGVSVPLGTISGISFLSGKGPELKASFIPAGSVSASFRSEFLSAGINQTLHRIKLHLTATVQIVLPGMTETVTCETQAAVSENVIVGEVPQVFTNVERTEDMLNLIPTEPLPPD
ncbi:MAG: Sporulation protein YunB [Firmicutes bacterium ADurb.Bin182]|nr:MAG: Sporulation protein YunB [Firmicutes bacterium ADurb.Bin182]